MGSTSSGRGQLSNIDLLPEDIRLQINEALRDRQLTQRQILDAINPLLIERGEKTITRSSINRYSMRIEENNAMMREAREAANTLVGGLGEQKGTDLGQAVTEMVKILTFKIMLSGRDGDGEAIDIDTLYKVALISQRVERASRMSQDRQVELSKQVLKKAVNAIEEKAKVTGGLSDEAVELIRQEILGVNKK